MVRYRCICRANLDKYNYADSRMQIFYNEEVSIGSTLMMRSYPQAYTVYEIRCLNCGILFSLGRCTKREAEFVWDYYQHIRWARLDEELTPKDKPVFTNRKVRVRR